MAKRLSNKLWGMTLQKTMTAMTRNAMRSGSRIMTQALKQASRPPAAAKPVRSPLKPARAARPAATRKPRTAAATGSSLRGTAIGPAGARVYHLYQPPAAGPQQRLPLLVMLHGCSQSAASFAASTRMNRLAAQQGFCVLYPEQDRLANPQGCWNWYSTRSRAAYAEAATLIAAIDQVALFHPIDLSRVAVAGLSAGAGMAALLASRYPTRFRAVAMHSGVPPGSANSTASALGAMLGTRRAPASTGVAGTTAWPPLLVIHGSKDPLVAAVNGQTAAVLWSDAAGARASAPRTVQRGQRRAMTITDYKVGGRVAASLCEIDGLGHAWSGGAVSQAFGDASGPDASRMVWAFVSRQFASLA